MTFACVSVCVCVPSCAKLCMFVSILFVIGNDGEQLLTMYGFSLPFRPANNSLFYYCKL